MADGTQTSFDSLPEPRKWKLSTAAGSGISCPANCHGDCSFRFNNGGDCGHSKDCAYARHNTSLSAPGLEFTFSHDYKAGEA